MVTRLALVLGDQLSPAISSLAASDPDTDVVVMAEVQNEASYVPHHAKKLAFVFSAMRQFAGELTQLGWRVEYARLDSPGNQFRSFSEVIGAAIARLKPERVVVTAPGEWRVLQEIEGWAEKFEIPVEILEDDRFVCSRNEFTTWADGRKSMRMEYFYREMRRKTGILMDGDAPVGGRWNFDSENRKPAPSTFSPPAPIRFAPDETVHDVIAMVNDLFPERFGDPEPFWFATTRTEAEAARDDFFDNRLQLFGDYQDAMAMGERFMAHSVLSHYLNIGLLDPLDLCTRAERAYREGRAPLNAVEGFVRQIIGWREFVRGVYWREGRFYTKENALAADIPLPEFYWSADTDMQCVAEVVRQTRDEAYAHHIQRLMVTGAFALIAGIDPHDVHEWYLAVYADAYEWVEAPNVIGMALFADDGVVASKPYAASGAYINRMSDYCGSCRYSVARKTEEDACPFNSLYWDFLIRNEKRFRSNPRIGRAYATWARMKPMVRKAYLARAATLRSRLRDGTRV
ncbi:MAG: cryptochrome/photolyase family protein [Alphaproteobacteria bacterium]|nr:cryptochrome/photolyase family protein [Alphaproteobacteria bacterium]